MNKVKLSKNSIVTICVLAFIILSYIYIIGIKQYPFYYLLLFYLLSIVAVILIFFPSFIAIVGNYSNATGKTERARKLLLLAIKLKTKSPMAYLNYAIMLVREGDGKTALSYLEHARSLNPKVITRKNIMLTMGSSYWVMGEIEKAIEVLEELRATHDYVNAHVLTTLGYMYFLNNDEEKALFFTNKAIEEDPESAAAWDNLGQIYYKSKELPKAEEAFQKAIGFKNNLVDSHYYLGLIAELENNPQKAKEHFEKANQCDITSLNTVTKQQVEAKYHQHEA